MAAKAKAVDWLKVEEQFRAGILTSVAIGKAHGISHTAVNKRAKAEGWTRDLSKRIEAARETKVSRAMVSPKVAEQKKATEEQVVQANAQAQTNIILAHRQDLQAIKATVIVLAGEVTAVSNRDLQEALELVLDEKTDKASQAYKTALTKAFNAALALGGRTKSARDLVASLATLIDKERQAFGIDKDFGDRKSLGEFLDAMA